MSDDLSYLGTGEAARMLAVGVSTVKRWVASGRLSAALTAGRHRKIPLADVQRVAQEMRLPTRATGTPAGFSPEAVAAFAGQFQSALESGDLPQAQTVLRAAHAGGVEAARIGDELIAPSMEAIGEGWVCGALDVYEEHRATQVCAAALHALRSHLPTPADEGAPLALGGGPEGDPSVLANLLVEMTLAENGWRVENVGPDTPMASLRRAVRDRRPRLVWVSCSHLPDPERFLKDYAPLYHEATAAGAAVAVGGRALTPSVRRRMLFTHHGDTLGHLAEYARVLR